MISHGCGESTQQVATNRIGTIAFLTLRDGCTRRWRTTVTSIISLAS
jgi:hypothetical protein